MSGADLIALASQEGLPSFTGSFDEATELWQELALSADSHLWLMGAIAACISAQGGGKDVRRFAHDVRVSERRVYQIAATYRAFKDKRRSAVLSFSHHQIAALADDPQRWIERAEDEEWSTRQLRNALAAPGEEPEPPAPPVTDEEVLAVFHPGPVNAGRLKGFYNYLSRFPCLKCGSRENIELAHLACFPSERQGGMMPRRKGVAAYACVPLCAACHRGAKGAVHEIGEAAFLESIRSPAWVFGWLAKRLAEYADMEDA